MLKKQLMKIFNIDRINSREFTLTINEGDSSKRNDKLLKNVNSLELI